MGSEGTSGVFLLKVQRSLNPGPSSMLVYNETRSILFQAPLDPLLADAMGDRAKVYFTATLEGEMVEFLQEAEDQEQAW